MPDLTATQWAGIGMVVVAALLGVLPSLAARLRRPATPEDGNYDMDDVMALRRLELRGQRLGCAEYTEGLNLIRQHFFAPPHDA